MSLYSELVREDFVSLWKDKLESGRYVLNPQDNRIYSQDDCGGTPVFEIGGPWIYTHPELTRRCVWYQDIEDTFGFIPKPCLSCWKVVVRPRNLIELFALWKLQVEMASEDPTCYCKCGIEVREYVFGNYGGYFYNTTKEHLQEKYKKVRKAVDEQISPDVIVYPKRYCTEFELKYGPSNEYEQPPETELLEELIEKACVIIPRTLEWKLQPEGIINSVIRRWIRFAWDRGDETVLQYTQGEPLSPKSVTYFPEEE